MSVKAKSAESIEPVTVTEQPFLITASQMASCMPAANSSTLAKYFPFFATYFGTYEITDKLEVAHFLSQVGHESGDLTYTEEIASGVAYEGRHDLGNNQVGDGVRFKGRGFIQLTGRENYSAFGRYKGRDFLTGRNPSLISTEPDLCVETAFFYWKLHVHPFFKSFLALNQDAAVQEITRRVNGGTSGLQDRSARFMRAKSVLGF